MLGIGFAEILMLSVLSGSIGDTDLIAMVQPAHYFKSKQIEITIDRAIEYASDDPKDAKTQIVQLTALRYLADEADGLKKSAKYTAHRQTLEAIAQGKKAQDATGFAKDYAARVLMKLDGKVPVPAKHRPVREDALAWFPAAVTMAGAVDLRQMRTAGAADPLKDLLKLMPDREKTKMYEFIEKCGNVRIERAAFAHKEGTGQGAGDGKIYMRVTGKGNHDWVVESIKMIEGQRGRLQIKQSKDEKGTPITTLQDPNNPPLMMIIGDTDFLVVGHERRGNDNALGDEVLEARAKKKPNAASRALKTSLGKIPDRAVAFLVGDLPHELRNGPPGFTQMPKSATAFIERVQQGLDVQVETAMANRDDADNFVQKVGGLRKDGIAGLQQLMKQPQPLPPGFPAIPYQQLINTLESLQVSSKAEGVNMRLVVPDGLLQQGLSGMMLFGAVGGAPIAPPPPPAKN